MKLYEACNRDIARVLMEKLCNHWQYLNKETAVLSSSLQIMIFFSGSMSLDVKHRMIEVLKKEIKNSTKRLIIQLNQIDKQLKNQEINSFYKINLKKLNNS